MPELTQDHLKYLSEFKKITGIYPFDCIDSDASFIFLVENRGELYKCIGKDKSIIRHLTEIFNKPVFVFVKADDVESQLKNIFYNLSNLAIKTNEKDGRLQLTLIVPEAERGYAVGKAGAKIKGVKELLFRRFNIKDFQLRTTREFRAETPRSAEESEG